MSEQDWATQLEGQCEPPQAVVEAAISFSKLSPCRSKRGVVVFDGEQVRGGGYNYKPRGFDCDGSEACKSTCGVQAVHAEQQALLSLGRRANECDMLHVKTIDGLLVPSGPPCCVQCSKLALVAGIKAVWLFRGEDGWVRYPADVFHQLSLDSANLAEMRAQPPQEEPNMDQRAEAEKVLSNLKDDNIQIAEYIVQRCGDFVYDRQRRDFIAEFIRAARQVATAVAERRAAHLDAQKLADAVEKYAEWCGGVHDADCPEDDTCSCTGKWINDGVTGAVNYLREVARRS